MRHARRILQFIGIAVGAAFLTFLLFSFLTALLYTAAHVKGALMVP